MPQLEALQSMMTAALDHGPEHLHAEAFAGTEARILAGMKVHANTISHARLIALEETFPRTRDLLGVEYFNQLSRDFLDWPGTASRRLPDIGDGFADFLADQGEGAEAIALAAFEWQWLASYHAPDMPALCLADLAGIAPDALLETQLVTHPAAAMLKAPTQGQAELILITRPDQDVLERRADVRMEIVFRCAAASTPICNLLNSLAETPDDEQPESAMQALVSLIEAGALMRADD